MHNAFVGGLWLGMFLDFLYYFVNNRWSILGNFIKVRFK